MEMETAPDRGASVGASVAAGGVAGVEGTVVSVAGGASVGADESRTSIVAVGEEVGVGAGSRVGVCVGVAVGDEPLQPAAAREATSADKTRNFMPVLISNKILLSSSLQEKLAPPGSGSTARCR